MSKGQELKDYLYAQGMSLASAASVHVPALHRRISAPHGDLSLHTVAARWRYSRQSTNAVPRWIRFAGHSASGHTSGNYEVAGIVQVDSNELNILQDQYAEAYEAVAFQIGRNVMVGTAINERQSLFAANPGDERRVNVAMRIGKGPLLASAGVWVNTLGFLGVRNISAGPIISLDELSSSVPVPF